MSTTDGDGATAESPGTGTSQPASQDVPADPGLGPHRAHILPAGPNAGIVARAVVRSSCRAWGVGQSIEDVAVHCASELGTNTHLHVDYSKFMGRTARIYVWIQAHYLIVDVRDPDPNVPDFDMADDLDADEPFMPGFASMRESGRGLHIVRALVRDADGFYHGEAYEDGKHMFIGLPLDPPEDPVRTIGAAA